MASSSALTLRLTSPPDFILCNNIYGANLSPQDCFIAANSHLPAGNEPLVFNTDPSIHQFYEFPLVVRHGGCQISVEAAGPNLPPSIVIIPDDLRRNARSITEKCVISRWGIGGFSTFGIRSLILYTLDSMSDLIGPYPTNTAFVTITISSLRRKMPSPGKYDPSIAVGLANAARQQARVARIGSTAQIFGQNNVQIWESHSALMQRGDDRTPWWFEFDPSADEMTYDCDADLGSPEDADCSQIGLSQPKLPSQTLEISPNEVKFLDSNTCFVAISATLPITISWAQIQAALRTLQNFCLMNPSQPAQGGRAYHVPQNVLRKGVDKRQSQVTGLNALPPHVNLTMAGRALN